MNYIHSKWARVDTDKGENIHLCLYQNKPKNISYLYENIKISIKDNIMTFIGDVHYQCYLLNFDSSNSKHWFDNLSKKPLKEYEYLIKECYKSLSDKIKGIKSKYIEDGSEYIYAIEKNRKIISNRFIIEYLEEDVLESEEDIKTFNELTKEIKFDNHFKLKKHETIK